MELHTTTCTISLSDETGALRSFRASHAPDQEFLIPDHGDLPLFVVQYLDANRRLAEVSSAEAKSVVVRRHTGSGEDRIDVTFEHVGALDLTALATVRTQDKDPSVYWDLSLSLPTSVPVLNVQYPFVVVRYDLGGDAASAKLLRPYSYGMLYQNLRPRHFAPDWPELWQMLPQNGDSAHYPGLTFAQFLAYYNQQAGLLLSCRDNRGNVKLIQPAHREPGLRLGIAHVVGWTTSGEHTLGYSVAAEAFQGDWYDAAERYRQWSLQQPWTRTPLTKRADLPSWLEDSPLHIVMRIQGEVDAGPTQTHPEFTPYENALPLLDRVAEQVGGPLAPVIMSWERPGPWVYPDCFPPAGGAESLTTFTAEARRRGWHVGTYCNGTRWATAHKWSGYRGDRFFQENGGPESISRLPDGRPWSSQWDQSWRPSHAGCIGHQRTKELLWNYAQTLLDLGLDWIQILDQNVGASTFPCYSAEHPHPSVPGSWMTEAMESLLAGVTSRGVESRRDVAWSVECPCCEYFIPRFVICDIRPDFRTNFVPLYYYLYHDYIMTQSMFAPGPNPHFLVLKFARAFILGDVLGCHLGAGGRLQNWEPPRGQPWMDWDQPAGDQDGAYALLRNATALRRGVGRDFLTFGRMLRPTPVTGVARVTWTWENEANDVPAVENTTWQAPDGRVAIVLANWTGEEQVIQVDLATFAGRAATIHLADDGVVRTAPVITGGLTALSLPAHACALLVVASPH